MSNPLIRIHNIETNELIDREMTEAEFAAYQADLQATAIAQLKEQEKLDAKKVATEKLAALGLTADDLKALGL